MSGNSQGIVLQERDRRLLGELAVMRVADREQIKLAARFGSTSRANARLLALTRSGLLRRFFLGTVGGARKALYAVSSKGAALVSAPVRGPRRGRDQTLVADVFVSHQLEINNVYCTLKHTAIPVPDVSFVRWQGFHEPFQATTLIPDGYAELSTPSKPLAMFLEVDLGNESRAVWQKKVSEYLRYAVSGNFQRQFAHPQFRVLVLANSERRLASLRGATAKITDKIFWFATLSSLSDPGFWSPIWQRAISDQRTTFL